MNRAERHSPVETPHNLGRYRIRGLLGEGGMGRLYVAEQTGIEGFAKIVAVKRILPHLASSEHFRSLFLNEARVAARLEHPNIVATHELGEADGCYFIAMEYLPGEDLGAILARCQSVLMPVEVAALLAQQCANGLHYAHELRDSLGHPSGIVHRDVNPSNIFVTYHGALKLLDFGVVKAATAPARTLPGAFKGKYAYCAPEQLSADSVDPRTDVFSLGIVLWECLTGSRLFSQASDAATIDAVRGQTIVPPSFARPDVPLELNHITMRALFRDPSHRYQSAAEMSEALDHFLSEVAHRPTSKSVGRWLEGLFGTERAALKRMIAQGGDIEQALVMLGHTDAANPSRRDSTGAERLPTGRRLRPLWSTAVDRTTQGRGSGSPPPARMAGDRSTPPATEVVPALPAPPPPARRARPALVGLAAGLLAAAAFTLLLGQRQEPPAPAISELGTLRIESNPGGAHIFVDGDPSGLTTPALVRQLAPGRTVEIRLVKAGYTADVRRIGVLAGESPAQLFTLREATGAVRLEGVPSSATVYLDNVKMDGHQGFTAAVGPHRLRIEEASDVIFSNSVEVRPGEQRLRIRAERRSR